MIRERNIVACILLSIVTCGIYGIIWFVWLTDDANTASGTHGTSGGMSYLLALVTCGIYALFWAFKQGEKIDMAKRQRGMMPSDNKVVYLLLCMFGLGIVAYALMQSELNAMATKY